MLHIHLASITETGLELDEVVALAALPQLQALSREGDVAFNSPVHVNIHATLAGETVVIEGHVEAGVHLTCSRCLGSFDQCIQSDFSVTAIPEPPASSIDSAEEIELTAEDMAVITYDGNSIDLHEEVAQQILMALPFNPLCQPSCKGLCSGCGVDLNQTACRCVASEAIGPFAVLKTLSLPSKKD